MQQRKLFYYLLFISILASCMYEPLNHDSDGPPGFSTKDAKEYFESKAKDLLCVDFSAHLPTRSARINGNITPQWDAAQVTQTGTITTIEVPLEGDVSKMVRTSMTSTSNKVYGFMTVATTKLIIQHHHASGTSRQFVVTMIDDARQAFKKDKTRNYYGKNDFSGYIIISAVTGEYLASFRSSEGKWTKVFMSVRQQHEPQNSGVVKLSFLGADATPATYNLGEADIRCPKCTNLINKCTCCKFCDGSGCSECEVLVSYCQKCKQLEEECMCCPRCHNLVCTCNEYCLVCSKNPCVCEPYVCKYCGNKYCQGSCQGTEEKPDKCTHKLCPDCGKPIRSENGTLARSGTNCPVAHSEYCSCVGTVSLSIDKTEVDLGEEFVMRISLSKPDLNISHINYGIKKGPLDTHLQSFNAPAPLNYRAIARSPGTYTLYAEVATDGASGTLNSNEVNITMLYPTRERIMRHNSVTQGMEASWNETLNAADATGIQEFGGVVMINTRTDNTGSLYQYMRREGKKTSYDKATITVPLNYEDKNYGPVQGGEFCVLIFHTHPPYWGYKGSDLIWRPIGPSVPDLREHTAIPAVVLDFWHSSGKINTLMNASEYQNSDKLYHYGVDRRIN